MSIEEIERLAALCAGKGVGEIELEEAGFSLRLRIETVVREAPADLVATPRAEAAFDGVTAPGVGLFRLEHPTIGRPVAEPGRPVRKGDTVGVLQIESCLKAVVAPADGVLGAALVEDGTVVGYGTPLYELIQGK